MKKYRNLALLTQMGLNVAVPILMMTFLGQWIDKKLGFEMLFTIILLILGSMTGLYNIYKIGMEGTHIGKDSSKENND